MIIGAAKAGTTSLYEYLGRHPDVVPASVKEPHYFDVHPDRSVSWYQAYFPLRVRLGGRRITGEASPYYLFHPDCPARAHTLVPDAKLIVLLREPVARAFSHYRDYVRNGEERRPFDEVVAEELRQLEQRLVHAGARHESSEVRHRHRRHSLLARGFYANQLELWFAHYPRENFLILKSETMFADPAATFARAVDFLGLRAFDGVEFGVHNASPPLELPPELRDRLHSVYEAPNRRLEALLGSEFTW